MKNNFISISRGFTLVELLVVIAIIGILSSIVYVNLNNGREVARDEVRKTSLKEVQLALELYKAQNGRYPSNCRNDTQWAGTNNATYGASCTPENYIAGLVPDFIPSLPWDSQTTTNKGYLYRTNSSGSEYKLMAWNSIEVKKIASYDDEFARCPYQVSPGGCSNTKPPDITYAVYSAGAATW